MSSPTDQENKSAKRKRSEDKSAEDSHDEKATKTEEASQEGASQEETSQEEAKQEEELLWTEEMHRNFVTAIYDTGVAQSSPSVILENMDQHPTDGTAAAAAAPSSSLTSERVKSHLQKYRKNKHKSKEEFLKEYDSFLRKAVTVGGASGIMPPAAMIEMVGVVFVCTMVRASETGGTNYIKTLTYLYAFRLFVFRWEGASHREETLQPF